VAAYVAGALTLCATSDFLTNSPIAEEHFGDAHCGGVLCRRSLIQGQSATWLVVSVALGQATGTVDGSSHLLCPLLFWASAQDTRKRVVLATGTWAVAVIPVRRCWRNS
jgi:hypothetical protein